MLFHYGYNSFQNPIFADRCNTLWIKIEETAHLSQSAKYIEVESFRDFWAELAYKGQGDAIYLPPSEKELHELTKFVYANDKEDEEQGSRASTVNLDQSRAHKRTATTHKREINARMLRQEPKVNETTKMWNKRRAKHKVAGCVNGFSAPTPTSSTLTFIHTPVEGCKLRPR